MERRDFLAAAGLTLGGLMASRAGANVFEAPSIANGGPIAPPRRGPIRVAFAINDGATVIDFCGPWEVFQDVMLVQDNGRHHMPFELYTVGPTEKMVKVTGGMQIVPNYSVDNAPDPHLVVVPALRTHDKLLSWLREVEPATDVTMSVCTGAFQLGKAGILDGLSATTHHDFYDAFAERFPDVELHRGMRFVDNGHIATAGGLTSGIDLALRVVERYYGREVAQRTADYMEYTSPGWRVASI